MEEKSWKFFFFSRLAIIEKSDKTSYRDLIKLLHPNVEINPIMVIFLKYFGNFRRAFVLACKKKKNYDESLSALRLYLKCLVGKKENELKDLEIKTEHIDRIYEVKCQESTKCPDHPTINLYRFEMYVRMHYKKYIVIHQFVFNFQQHV